jgi:hypothetical protein
MNAACFSGSSLAAIPLQHVSVPLRADQKHVPGLLLSQQIARPPLIQIGHAHLEAGTQTIQLDKALQPIESGF